MIRIQIFEYLHSYATITFTASLPSPFKDNQITDNTPVEAVGGKCQKAEEPGDVVWKCSVACLLASFFRPKLETAFVMKGIVKFAYSSFSMCTKVCEMWAK